MSLKLSPAGVFQHFSFTDLFIEFSLQRTDGRRHLVTFPASKWTSAPAIDNHIKMAESEVVCEDGQNLIILRYD